MDSKLFLTPQIPDEKSLTKLLSDLCTARITATACSPWPIDMREKLVFAAYQTDDEKVIACGVVDILVGASISAILTRIPPAELVPILATNQLPEEMVESLKEVMNIFSKLLNAENSPHITLKDIYQVPPAPDGECLLILTRPMKRCDFNLSIPGYKDGRLSFLTKLIEQT